MPALWATASARPALPPHDPGAAAGHRSRVVLRPLRSDRCARPVRGQPRTPRNPQSVAPRQDPTPWRRSGTNRHMSNHDPDSAARFEGDDLYAALGVPAGATDEEITRAYRRLARAHHPDA